MADKMTVCAIRLGSAFNLFVVWFKATLLSVD